LQPGFLYDYFMSGWQTKLSDGSNFLPLADPIGSHWIGAFIILILIV
jgi:hypothetical protein